MTASLLKMGMYSVAVEVKGMWPTPQDYNEAVQTPQSAFADKELRKARPQLNQLGLPKPVSGSFASVYQLNGENGSVWAVRCFLRNVPHQEERYARISEHLKQRPLKWTTPFEFVREGIRVGGRWYPILKMQWVSGVSLTEWIERNIGDNEAMRELQNSFSEMCTDLRRSEIAHGDLQHGNVLVAKDGGLQLVDYDGLFVPALASMGSAELGHRHYQHPRRSSAHYGMYLDNFSAWSIWASLHCVGQDARLWRKLGGGEECLLFRQEDYAQPDESVAFAYLEQHENDVIVETSRTMRRLLTLDPTDVPPLGEPIVGADHVSDLPPFTVPGLEAGGGSGASTTPADVVVNLRAAVAAAKAPTVVLTAPRVKLVEDPDVATRSTTSSNNAPWFANQTVNQQGYTPPPATPSQTPQANPSSNNGAWVLGVFAFIMILSATMSTSYKTEGWKDTKPPVQSAPLNKAPFDPSTYFIVENINEPLSKKFSSSDEAIGMYQKGVSDFKNGLYDSAMTSFLNARNLYWAIDFDRSLCDYQVARCLMAKSAAKPSQVPAAALQNAMRLMMDAHTAADKSKFWIPGLGYDIGNAYLQMGANQSAAETFSHELRFLAPQHRADNIVGLRAAASRGLANAESDFDYYTTFAKLAATDPVALSLLPKDQTPEQLIHDDLSKIISKLEDYKRFQFAAQVARYGAQRMNDFDKAKHPLVEKYAAEFKAKQQQLEEQAQNTKPK